MNGHVLRTHAGVGQAGMSEFAFPWGPDSGLVLVLVRLQLGSAWVLGEPVQVAFLLCQSIVFDVHGSKVTCGGVQRVDQTM